VGGNDTLVNFLKVDYRDAGNDATSDCGEYLPRGIALLAEKVETETELDREQAARLHVFSGILFLQTDDDDEPGHSGREDGLRANPERSCQATEFKRSSSGGIDEAGPFADVQIAAVSKFAATGTERRSARYSASG